MPKKIQMKKDYVLKIVDKIIKHFQDKMVDNLKEI